jgi:predicted Rossmann fold flavoprotein
MKLDAIIVGGGAAGLFCAIEAGKRGRQVLVIEHNAQVGRKIIISGGGRCNFTNLDIRPENFISNNPHFCKSALARYSSVDFVKLVKKHKIEFYEKKLGQLFCRQRSHLIVEMLLKECERYGVKIFTDCSVKRIEKDKLFKLTTNKGNFKSENLVIATGGLSFPKIGATNFGFQVADQFGIKTTKLRPSLVPLIFTKEQKRLSGLAGVSLDSIAKYEKQVFRENILFTHRGLSGPAVLQISNYWQPDSSIEFNLLPEMNLLELINQNRTSKQSLVNFLARILPNRFAEEFTKLNFSNKPVNQLSNKEIQHISGMLNQWPVKFCETEGWHKAEVTLGGIDTGEISSQTMEASKQKGLYFIGEVLDVTGWLGGYNFQWAWASGFVSGQAV